MNKEKQVRQIMTKTTPRFYWYMGASFLLSLVVQGVMLLPPVIMQRLIDVYIPSSDLTSVALAIVAFALIPIVTAALTSFYNALLAIVGQKASQSLFILCCQKILHRPLAFFDANNSSELASYCKSETMKYILLWLLDIPNLFASIVSGLVILALLLNIHPTVGLVQLLYAPVLFLPSMYFAKKAKQNIGEVIQQNAKLSQILSDMLRGIRTIKSLCLETLQLNKLKEANQSILRVWTRVSIYDNINGAWNDVFVDMLFTGITFGIGAWFILKGGISLGMLVVILGYLPRLYSSIRTANEARYGFTKQLGEFDKLFDLILDDESDETGELEYGFEDKIEFENVRFAYDQEKGTVLDGLSFEIRKGEWLGIVGESGIGKSTILHLLLKLYLPESGKIRIDGTDIQNIKTHSLRQSITLISQQTFLFPGSIKDNLSAVNPNASEEDLWEALRKAGLSKFVHALPQKLDTNIGENGVQLSGGERQRLAIAQGLLRNNGVLLLDEVTSNLDAETEDLIMQTIEKLNENDGLTIICVTHRERALGKANRILNLSPGRKQ